MRTNAKETQLRALLRANQDRRKANPNPEICLACQQLGRQSADQKQPERSFKKRRQELLAKLSRGREGAGPFCDWLIADAMSRMALTTARNAKAPPKSPSGHGLPTKTLEHDTQKLLERVSIFVAPSSISSSHHIVLSRPFQPPTTLDTSRARFRPSLNPQAWLSPSSNTLAQQVDSQDTHEHARR